MTQKEIQDKVDRVKEQLEEEKKNRIQSLIKRFNEMEPFEGDVRRIPLLPVIDKEIYDEHIVPNLIRCGAIPKEKLIIGHTYLGDCRNASKAVWKENGCFEYMRTKFGWTYPEEINHFQDDDGYDVFTPIKDITEHD